MDLNSGNLRWFYILEALIEDENDPELKNRFKRCQDILPKYPLVIKDVEGWKIFQNFDEVVIQKMRERIELEENFLNNTRTQETRQRLGNLSENRQNGSALLSNQMAEELFGPEKEFSFNSLEPDTNMAAPSTGSGSGKPGKKPCKYGRDCYRRNQWHLQEFSHPDDGNNNPKDDDVDDDVEEFFYNKDVTKKQELQEAEDLRLAMQLSQQMNYNDRFQDEFDEICNKPSAAFELENSNPQIHNEGDVSQNEVFQSKALSASSTPNVQKDYIPDAKLSLVNAFNENSMNDFGGFSNSSDEDEIQYSQFSQVSRKTNKMVGKLENVKEKDQYTKDLELALQLSQQYNQTNVSNERAKGDKKKKKNENNSIDEELNINPSVDKKSKKIPLKGKAKNNIFANDPIFRRYAASSDDEAQEPPRVVNKKPKKKTQPSATITSANNTQPNTSQGNAAASSEDEVRTPRKRSTSQSPWSSEKKKRSSYIPKPRSGGYAILLGLYDNRAFSERTFMRKDAICAAAQQYCDESMTRTRPGAGQFYNGWSSAATLVKKELIVRVGIPLKVWLTHKGKELAEEIIQN